jgi:Domain of unknown function (DUF4169)
LAEIINLRRTRKAKARSQAQAAAAENRAKHGRPKAEPLTSGKVKSLAERRLDAHRRPGTSTDSDAET